MKQRNIFTAYIIKILSQHLDIGKKKGKKYHLYIGKREGKKKIKIILK